LRNYSRGGTRWLAAGFGLLCVTGAKADPRGNTSCPHRRRAPLAPAEGLGRGRASRAWIAIRDMDVPAEIIGIRPLRTKLLAFLSSFYRGIAGAVRAFI
jgi:branched-chain amino acid transport system permease protein